MYRQKFSETVETSQDGSTSCISLNLSQPIAPVQLTHPIEVQERQGQTYVAQVVPQDQPLPQPLTTLAPLESPPVPDTPTPVSTEDPLPKPPVIRILKSGARKAQPKRARKTQSRPKKSLSPPASLQVSQESVREKKATNAFSLRFKKIGPTPPDSTATPQPPRQSPFPSSPPHFDSVHLSEALQPSEHAQADDLCQLLSLHPPGPAVPCSRAPSLTPPQQPISHSPQISFPPPQGHPTSETPAPKAVVNGQIDLDPPHQRYPDNSFLPKLNNYPHALAQELGISSLISTTHYSVEEVDAKLGLGFDIQGDGEVESVVDGTSVAMLCCCSRFRYDPQCPSCGSPIEGRQRRTSIPGHNSWHHKIPGRFSAWPEVQVLGAPVAPRTMAKPPNSMPLGKRRAWGTLQVCTDENRNIPVQFLMGPCSPPEDWTKLPTHRFINEPPHTEACSSTSPQLPPSEPITASNTTHRAPDGQDVLIPASGLFKTSSNHYTVLQGPVLTGEAHIPTKSIPIPRNTIPLHAPAPYDTPDGLSLGTDSISLPSLDQEVTTTDTTTSALLKRKGKERCREPESSDDESLSVEVVGQHIAKKAKLKHVMNGYHIPSAEASESKTSTACSSKTKLEDLPVPKADRRGPKSRVKIEDPIGPGVEQAPQAPRTDVYTKTSKRRGRPPKNAKLASSAISLPSTHDLLMQVDPSAPEPAPQSQPELPLDLSISAAKPGSRASKVKSQKTLPVPTGPVPRKENGVPVSIPDEIQALVGAYIGGMPVGIFAARRRLKDFWGLKLPQDEEIGYAFMGFYRISRVWESLIEEEVDVGGEDTTRGKRLVEEGIAKLQVRWKFRMRWEPGGEAWQICERDNLSSPWWSPGLEPQGLSAVPQPDLEDSDDESTIMYRTARRKNPTFARRHCFFNQAFFSVLPLHLLAPVLTEIPDSAFPRGWLCEDCGKLNFRYYLRHRRCSSSYCKVALVYSCGTDYKGLTICCGSPNPNLRVTQLTLIDFATLRMPYPCRCLLMNCLLIPLAKPKSRCGRIE